MRSILTVLICTLLITGCATLKVNDDYITSEISKENYSFYIVLDDKSDIGPEFFLNGVNKIWTLESSRKLKVKQAYEQFREGLYMNGFNITDNKPEADILIELTILDVRLDTGLLWITDGGVVKLTSVSDSKILAEIKAEGSFIFIPTLKAVIEQLVDGTLKLFNSKLSAGPNHALQMNEYHRTLF